MKKQEINELLKNKEIIKLVEKCKKEIKRHNKLINENKKKFDKIIEEAQKNRSKFGDQSFKDPGAAQQRIQQLTPGTGA